MIKDIYGNDLKGGIKMDLERALEIAIEAHRGQLDKGGEKYIYHPLRVMSQMDTNEERIVAILHDVLEDTNIDMIDLFKEGFDDHIIKAIKFLSRDKDEKYLDYIKKIKEYDNQFCEGHLHTLVYNVKLADLEDNMELSRLNEVTDKDISRQKRYMKAKKILLEEIE